MSTNVVVIPNDAPYGQERTFQGLRMADALLTFEEELDLTDYLASDAVLCAKAASRPRTATTTSSVCSSRSCAGVR